MVRDPFRADLKRLRWRVGAWLVLVAAAITLAVHVLNDLAGGVPFLRNIGVILAVLVGAGLAVWGGIYFAILYGVQGRVFQSTDDGLVALECGISPRLRRFRRGEVKAARLFHTEQSLKRLILTTGDGRSASVEIHYLPASKAEIADRLERQLGIHATVE
jgi:hypothetical protein